MAQIFKPRSNTLSKLVLLGLMAMTALALSIAIAGERSSYTTGVDVPLPQPVPFTHEHHVGRLGIDCRYCHTTVETSSFAGIPSTETCMNCHSQIWADSPMLAPVRESFKENRPLEWSRVNDLPDFVYFDHSIHVSKGVGCATCHGRVDLMPLTWKSQSLLMSWCIDCHEAPEKHLRPLDQVFNMIWTAEGDQVALGRRLIEENHVRLQGLTDCVTCHR